MSKKRNTRTDQNVHRNSLSVVSYVFFASLSARVQYPIGPVFSYCSFCSNAHPTRLAQASVSNDIHPVEFRKASTGVDINPSCNLFIAANSFSLIGSNFVG